MGFKLNYPTSCEDCGGHMARGSRAAYVGEGIVHQGACPPPPKTCPTCHMQLPVTGICDDCA